MLNLLKNYVIFYHLLVIKSVQLELKNINKQTQNNNLKAVTNKKINMLFKIRKQVFVEF